MPDRTAQVQIRDFKALNRNTLRGCFTASFPSGMVIRDLMLHEKGNERWVGLPGRQYVNAKGERQWTSIIEFTTRATAARFRDVVLAALDRFLEHMPADSSGGAK